MDPDQEQSDLGPRCLSKRLLKHFGIREKQTPFVTIAGFRRAFFFFYLSLLLVDSVDLLIMIFSLKVELVTCRIVMSCAVPIRALVYQSLFNYVYI